MPTQQLIGDLPQLFESAALFATSQYFVWGWCTLITAYTLRWFLKLHWEAGKIRRHIRSAKEVLASYRDKESLAHNFVDACAKISMFSKMRGSWKEYAATMIRQTMPVGLPTHAEEKALLFQPVTLRAPKEASEYFNDQTIIQPSIDIRFFSTVPTHLAGLGVLGNFCGLAAGIYLARGGFSGGQVEAVQHSLSELLNGASLAFTTSIFGIFGSIVFSRSEKGVIKKLRQCIDAFNTEVGMKVDLTSAEQIADLQLHQALRQNEQLGALVEKMSQMLDEKKHLNETTLTFLVKEFRQSMSAAAGAEIKNIAHAFRAVHEAVLGTEAMVHGMSSRLEADTMRVSEMLTQSVTDATRDMITSIREASMYTANQIEEPTKRFFEQVKTLNEKTTEALEHWSSTIAMNQKTMSEVIEVQRGLTGLVEPITRSTQAIANTYRNAQDVLIRSSQSVVNINEAMSHLEKAQQHTHMQWDNYCNRFEQVDKHLRVALQQTHQSLESYSDKVRDFTSDLDRQMSKGLMSLAGAVGDLHQVVGHLPAAIRDAHL